MLTFFKKIRRSLIGSGSGRYFLYAIGEIALVVIGILIALQINNWNEWKKERSIERQYLEKLQVNIAADTVGLARYIRGHSRRMATIDSCLFVLSGKDGDDSERLAGFLGRLIPIANFTSQSTAYTDLVSSGNLNIIRDQSLVDTLLLYYQKVDFIEEKVDEAVSHYNRQIIVPYLLGVDELPLAQDLINDKYQYDVDHRTIDELARDAYLISILKLAMNQTNRQRFQYQELKSLAKEIASFDRARVGGG